MSDLKLLRFDGLDPKPITKREIKRWLSRIREDLRDFQQALDTADPSAMKEYADDAAGAAAELQNIAEATLEEWEND